MMRDFIAQRLVACADKGQKVPQGCRLTLKQRLCFTRTPNPAGDPLHSACGDQRTRFCDPRAERIVDPRL